MNLYAYCDNNPVSYYDPSGYFSLDCSNSNNVESGANTKGAGGANKTTVGRWMSEAEYNKMVESGKVQMSPNGNTTYVANPSDINAFGKQAKPGSIYVEFDVDSSSIYPAGDSGWGQIAGPGSLYDRKNRMTGNLPIMEMPAADNIKIKGGK